MTTTEPTPSDSDENKFVVDFIKSQYFRVIFAEGFWGGTTIEDKVHISFWNSRDAIPRRITYKLDQQGAVADIDHSVRADQVREVEVGVIMGIETAKVLRGWLDQVITSTEESEANEDAENESGNQV